LIDHFGELARAGGADQRHHPSGAGNHAPRLVEGGGIAPDHRRQHPLTGTGLPDRNRRVEEGEAFGLGRRIKFARDAGGGGGVVDEHGTSVTCRKSSSLPTQQDTNSAFRAASAGVEAALPPYCLTRASGCFAVRL
jgi:hypothetical protein